MRNTSTLFTICNVVIVNIGIVNFFHWLSMGTVYILGAGFSKTCGIATDMEMLDSLNRILIPEEGKYGGPPRTTIEYLREQNFLGHQVGFELFMSTLSSLKFLGEYLPESDRNVFREEEQELRKALRNYLKSCVCKVNWEIEGKTILDFMGQVDWEQDFILTFNYDLLLVAAAKRLNLKVEKRIIHLHGDVGKKILAWPTYTKFAFRTTKKPLAPRWQRGFKILRNQAEIDRIVFIGYSMPQSDLEAKSLFNYSDWYNNNSAKVQVFSQGKIVPENKHYSYSIVVVNPCKQIESNYKFFRKKPLFCQMTLEKWLTIK